jgi:hypothetical protein
MEVLESVVPYRRHDGCSLGCKHAGGRCFGERPQTEAAGTAVRTVDAMEADWAAAEARTVAGLQLRPVLAALPPGDTGWVAMLGEPTPGMVHEVQTAATALKRAIALLGGGDTLGEGEETQQPWLAAWDVDRSTQRVRMVERFALREMLQVWERHGEGPAWRKHQRAQWWSRQGEHGQRLALRVLHPDMAARDLRWLAWCRNGQPQERLPRAAELWVAARVQALTAAMAGWVALRGSARVSRPRRLAMPDPAAAPLTLAPAAQRIEWVDVVVPEGVENGKKFDFAYGGVLYRVCATEAAGRTMRLPALMLADEGGGAAAAKAAAGASAVAGAGAGEGTEAGAGARAGVVVRVNRVTRRRRRRTRTGAA